MFTGAWRAGAGRQPARSLPSCPTKESAVYNQGMVNRAVLLGVALCFRVQAEVHSMTLREAVERAVAQNPDVTPARLDEEKARCAVRIAEGPFSAPGVSGGRRG